MASEDIVSKYKYFCVTEQAYFETLGYRTTPPTECINNNTHTIDENSISIVATISTKIVVTKDDTSGVEGDFQTRGTILDVPAVSGINYLTFNTPETKIKLVCFSISVDATNLGDTVTFLIYPYTPLALFTQNVNIGDTVVHITTLPVEGAPDPFSILIPGYIIYDGSNQTSLGFLSGVDSVNSTVTLSVPSPVAITAGTPMLFAIPRAWNILLNKVQYLTFGSKSNNFMSINANVPVGLFYNNANGQAKIINMIYEYYY